MAAATAGADAIGLVFHPAARRTVTVDQARKIVAALPPFVQPVGLFVDAGVYTMREMSWELGLRTVQLHGDEEPEMLGELLGLNVIKAIHVRPETLAADLAKWRKARADGKLANLLGIVLDTAAAPGAVPGGGGVANNWELIREHQQTGRFEGSPPLILAGGLNPANVGPVVRMLRPWAVDVSSGVEESLGRKSREKIEGFVRAVREADTQTAA